MDISVVFVFICFFIAGEAKKNRVHLIPEALRRDPFLTPREGILVTQDTPIYRLKKGHNRNTLFHKIPDAMDRVTEHLLNDEKYRKASVDDVNSSKNQTPHLTIPTSMPWEWPKIMYPHIIVVVANDLYRRLGQKLRDTIPYVLAFWNGVDMMFRSFRNPKIRFHIAGIILEMESGLLSYIRSDFKYLKYIHGLAIYEAEKFWYQHDEQIPVEYYNSIITMTTKSICGDQLGVCDEILAGQSFSGSMCEDASVQNGTRKVIIIEDNGKFSGIPTAAHELGHSLGISHDDDEKFRLEEELKKFPNCRNVSSGYIMSAIIHENVYEKRWSQCSSDQLTSFIEEKAPKCIYAPPISKNKKKKIHYIPRLLPGKLLNWDEQCANEEDCSAVLDTCKYTQCVATDEDYCEITTFSLAEGTPCDIEDPKKFCMFGKCLSEAAFT